MINEPSTMTETDWHASADPNSMLHFLIARDDDRKFRLFACACCRRVWKHIHRKACKTAVEVAERFADDLASDEERLKALVAAQDAYCSVPTDHENWRCYESAMYACQLTTIMKRGVPEHPFRMPPFFQADNYACRAHVFSVVGSEGQEEMEFSPTPEWIAAWNPERAAQSALLRDIFGNPFRPLPPRPEAIAPLAEQIYAGAWDQMPILGEWLQEHGYWSEGEHCLDPSIQHVKGCWVVDWVTGRE
jgi:hypothetical protein